MMFHGKNILLRNVNWSHAYSICVYDRLLQIKAIYPKASGYFPQEIKMMELIIINNKCKKRKLRNAVHTVQCKEWVDGSVKPFSYQLNQICAQNNNKHYTYLNQIKWITTKKAGTQKQNKQKMTMTTSG